MPRRPATLWSAGVTPDAAMFAYTAGDDREWDARLLGWDVFGSLGHIETLRASRLLTPREQEVLQRLAAGLTNREIAADLSISPETVKKHTGNIYSKLAVQDRRAAVARARALALLD